MRGTRQTIQYSLALEPDDRGEARVSGHQGAEPFVAKPAPESPALTEQSMSLSKLNPVEPPWYVTRMPGGVGGVAPRGVPLSRSSTHCGPSVSRFVVLICSERTLGRLSVGSGGAFAIGLGPLFGTRIAAAGQRGPMDRAGGRCILIGASCSGHISSPGRVPSPRTGGRPVITPAGAIRGSRERGARSTPPRGRIHRRTRCRKRAPAIDAPFRQSCERPHRRECASDRP